MRVKENYDRWDIFELYIHIYRLFREVRSATSGSLVMMLTKKEGKKRKRNKKEEIKTKRKNCSNSTFAWWKHTRLRMRRVHSTMTIFWPENWRECRRTRDRDCRSFFSLVVSYQLVYRWWTCKDKEIKKKRYQTLRITIEI